jgi:putative chitinase
MMPTGPIDFIDAPLLKLVSSKQAPELEKWVEPIKSACNKWKINKVRRVAAFISQQAHEGGFNVNNSRENMNYSAKRMAEVWPNRYAKNPGAARADRQPNAKAVALANKGAEAIANDTYANRLGNGGPETGDGFKFRGGAAGQLTGRTNWTNFAAAVGKSLDDAIDYACNSVEGSVASFGWFWDRNQINALADTPGINDETLAINGGTIGLEDRKKKFDALIAELLRRGA